MAKHCPWSMLPGVALATLLGLLAPAAHARTPARAHSQVRSWVASHPKAFGKTMGSPSGEVLTAANHGTNLFHSVTLSGGGFAVIADTDGTLLAFSDRGSFTATNAAPLWAMLLADTGASTPSRSTGPRLLSGSTDGSPSLPEGVSVTTTTVKTSTRLLSAATIAEEYENDSDIEDLRVSPLTQSTWDQSTVGTKNVYNYYTPGNVLCGCVATAMAQVMRYHEYPTSAVEAKTRACTYKTFDTITNLTMQGGTYDWSLMTLAPDGSITDEERMAIGKLMSDAGISVHMNYDVTDAGKYYGSTALAIAAKTAFTNIWQYAQAQYWENSKHDRTTDEGELAAKVMENAILANLDAGYPVLLGVANTSDNDGHETVVDGYGYVSKERYIHINMGWSGTEDYWYCFPIYAGGHTFEHVSDIIYNIFPRETGNIVSGHVTDANGVPVSGVTVKWDGLVSETDEIVSGTTKTSEHGVYAFIVPNASISDINISVAGFNTAETNTTSTSVSCSRSYSEADLESDPSGGSLPYPTFDGTQSVGNSWGNDLTINAQYIEPAFSSTPVISPADGSLTIETTATLGSKWILQCNDDLADKTGWTVLTNFTATGTTLPIVLDSTIFDWTLTPQAFFRLISDE